MYDVCVKNNWRRMDRVHGNRIESSGRPGVIGDKKMSTAENGAQQGMPSNIRQWSIQRKSGSHASRAASGFSPLRFVRMLLAAAGLGSVKARTAITFILFVLIWLLLSIPDAFAASSGTRVSGFTYFSSNGLLRTETVEPGDVDFELTTTYVYDGYGNKLSATTAGADIVSRTTSTAYDSRGRFATSVTNALGHSESWTHDGRFGVPLTQTGPNNLTTTWQYDSFGRKTLEIRADGNRTSFAYEYCAGVAGGSAVCPSLGAYVMTATPQNSGGAQNGPRVKTFHDTHGRVIRTESEGYLGAAILAETVYDSAGRVERESRPFFAGGVKQWTTYQYDDLGRVVGVTLPDSSSASFAFNGLTTSTTNDKNQTETTVKNARGETAAVIDANGKTVTYTYGPFGVRMSITDMAGNIISNTFDKAGRKIASRDPDLGFWTYDYNVLGELVGQTDAKSQTSTITYDKLGRPLTRVDNDGTSTWVYDTAAKGVGKLATSAHSNGYLRTQSYDGLGRPSSTATRIDAGGATETSTTTYDANGRVLRLTYPSGFAVEHSYSALGYMHQLREVGGGTLWTADVMDAELRLTQGTLGNGVTVWRTFDAARGFVTDIEAGTGNAVADFAYTFDTLGNLTYRADFNESLVENFTYDNLNRLTSYQIAGQTAKTVAYDDMGNITAKSDVGTYTYAASGAGAVRPHAVQSIAGTLNTTYNYDANGNMTSGSGRTLAWTAFNKVKTITQGAVNMTYAYGPDRERIKQTGPGGTTYYYSAGLYEKHVGASVTQWNDYLYAGGEMVGVHFSRSDATEMTRYFVKDHLGSIAVITDETGAVAERLSYDAWGKRRYPNGADDPTGVLTAQTTRGFTGHEMIDDVDLVNMNGRIYEPQIGRFLSPDPFIQDATNTQNLNRYTYVNNNPLSYTDPSGYFFKKLFRAIGKFVKKFWKPLLAIAAAFTLQFYALPALAGAGTGIGAFGSLVATQPLTAAVISGVSAGVGNVILTGKPKAFLTGFGQGVATFGVGSAFQGAKGAGAVIGKAVFHGVVGGGFAEARGGRFGSGFLAAGFSSAAGNVDFGSVSANLVKSAVVGGSGSVLGGGKFANGAVTGAFVYVLNDLSHKHHARRVARVLGKISVLRPDSTEAEFRAVANDLPSFARTIFAAGNAAVGRGAAGNLSYGAAYDRITDSYTQFVEGAIGVGFQAGVSVEVGFINGSLQNDFFGQSVTFDVDYGRSISKGGLGIGGGLIVINPRPWNFIWGAYIAPIGYSTAGLAVTFTGTMGAP